MIDEGFAPFVADEFRGAGLSPADALGYTANQGRWAVEHETELWLQALPNLASTDRKILDRFLAVNQRVIDGAPGKSAIFSATALSRILSAGTEQCPGEHAETIPGFCARGNAASSTRTSNRLVASAASIRGPRAVLPVRLTWRLRRVVDENTHWETMSRLGYENGDGGDDA